jgi:hypothetical protein
MLRLYTVINFRQGGWCAVLATGSESMKFLWRAVWSASEAKRTEGSTAQIQILEKQHG